MKGFGDEHFMVDEALLEKICGSASLTRRDFVLEVGAGTGNLTKKLAGKAGRVFAVEKNGEFFEKLSSEMGCYDNVELVCADATKMNLPECSKIVSNLPYSISRRITQKFILHGFEQAVLVYQREFAQKLTAPVGHDTYRMVSVLAQSTCDIEPLFDISPEAFDPQPNIWSMALRLRLRWKPGRDYVEFLNRLFSQKNKKVRNILDGAPREYSERKTCEMKPDEMLALYRAMPR